MPKKNAAIVDERAEIKAQPSTVKAKTAHTRN